MKRKLLSGIQLFCIISFSLSLFVYAGEWLDHMYDSGEYPMEEIGLVMTLPDGDLFSNTTRRSIQLLCDDGYDLKDTLDSFVKYNLYALLESNYGGGDYLCRIYGTSVIDQGIMGMTSEVREWVKNDLLPSQSEAMGRQDLIIDEYYSESTGLSYVIATFNTVSDDLYAGKTYITFFNGYQISISLTSETPGVLPFEVESTIDNLVESIKPWAGDNTNLVVVQRVIDKLKKNLDAEGVDCEIDEETGEISLKAGILFGLDEFSLSDEGKELLDKLFPIYVNVLLDEEFEGIIDRVVFEGHTDTSGSYDYNMILSENRANTVMDYCMTTINSTVRSIIEPMAESKGYSFDKPIYKGNGEVDMDASRRVVIKFTVTPDAYSSELTHSASE